MQFNRRFVLTALVFLLVNASLATGQTAFPIFEEVEDLAIPDSHSDFPTIVRSRTKQVNSSILE